MLWSGRLNPALARSRLLACVVLTVTYVAVGRLGLFLAVPPGYATAIFPPAGIAMAAMFIGGAITLPWTLFGSFLLNLWIGNIIQSRFDGLALAVALVIASASMSQAAIGGWALRRLIGYPTTLDTGRDLAKFFLGSPILCLTSATLSLGGLAALGVVNEPEVALGWLTWWMGDTLGGPAVPATRSGRCRQTTCILAKPRTPCCSSHAAVLRAFCGHLHSSQRVGNRSVAGRIPTVIAADNRSDWITHRHPRSVSGTGQRVVQRAGRAIATRFQYPGAEFYCGVIRSYRPLNGRRASKQPTATHSRPCRSASNPVSKSGSVTRRDDCIVPMIDPNSTQ